MKLPTSIPQLEEYYRVLPTITTVMAEADPPRMDWISTIKSDPFSRLAPEILLHIMTYLDITSVMKLRAASRAVTHVVLTNSYWKVRMGRDMPWLYDLPHVEEEGGKVALSIDWARVYKELFLASRANSATRILGLVNRRRIWELSAQIREPYQAKKTQQDGKECSSLPQTLIDAMSTPMPRLTLPEPRVVETASIPLINDYTVLLDAEPVISVHWTKTGDLAGISTVSDSRSPNAKSVLLGLEEHFAMADPVTIPRDDWLTGFILTTQHHASEGKRQIRGLRCLFAKQDPIQLHDAEGDQRLLRTPRDHFLVGFAGQVSNDGTLAKLALLTQPRIKAPYRVNRISDQHRASYNDQGDSYLWRNELPPPGLQITELAHGYWAYDMKIDVSPLESLVFGTNEEEISDMTAILGDVQFGGFEIQYAHRPPRRIGPVGQAMKSLSIDGRGGERIVHMYWGVNHIPDRVRFVTNRGRQLVLGHANEQRVPAEQLGNGTTTFSGFYGFWSDRHKPQTRLDAVGGFYVNNPFAMPGPPVEEPRDSNGFWWEPSPPPPAYLAEHGRVWGQSEYRDRFRNADIRTPGQRSFVCWLDCSRPLDQVRVTLCHGTANHHLPLSAITFRYADRSGSGPSGEEETIGPKYFSPPTDAEGANGHPWCFCAWGSKREDEQQARPHYFHETWSPRSGGGGSDGGGSRLRNVLVWLDEGGRLAGIQMVAVDSSESPKWGYCVGKHAGMIDLNAVNDDEPADDARAGRGAVGLKFFINSNGRSVTREDSVVVAIQALKGAG